MERAAAMIALLWMAGGLGGCVSAPERYARDVRDQTYRARLEHEVRAHVYPTACASLLPWAEQHFWEQGFERVSIQLDSLEVTTGWRPRGDSLQERYVVYGRAAGPQACAWQFLRTERAGPAEQELRDVDMEMVLLERIAPAKAREVRLKAQRDADRAYDETRQLIREAQQAE
ncbi:hypothetical protein DL240_17950 [Lujinxingia litoralis]|uniref:Uncharacterized protein n=1 Tax=Lujinxingia litoralis TaxID=2211119 RepID=A0A328C1G9_9DELT|nr:hypothetical protein [Lujinxingia litoralis]RAL20263.1 hypothetical protein DL240_17950 [Lujinxingia litoralis]